MRHQYQSIQIDYPSGTAPGPHQVRVKARRDAKRIRGACVPVGKADANALHTADFDVSLTVGKDQIIEPAPVSMLIASPPQDMDKRFLALNEDCENKDVIVTTTFPATTTDAVSYSVLLLLEM